MHIPIVLAFVVLQCTLCHNIRVPLDWSNDSEVNKNEQLVNTVKNEQKGVKLSANEYFQYPAKKPQFAVDIAAAHGVHLPENHYKSHVITPHTGLPRVELGDTRIQGSQNIVYPPYRAYIQNGGGLNYAKPASTSFEIYHPYKSEQPALQQLYKDPALAKIRNNLRDNDHKLQKYQNEVGALNVKKEEYLESPEEIDRKKLPEKNRLSQFELHKPERRPVYYKYPPSQNQGQLIINHKLRHPWNQHVGKVTPYHYRPIRKHLHGLRQQHALKYDDEHNEYPQLPQEDDEKKLEGYDIFEKGKAKFVQLKDNVDNTINKVVQQNRPKDNQNIESPKRYENQDGFTTSAADEEVFTPVKNYAQVRKTETIKHLPKEAAYKDAESLEEIQNAPRLREAIKSKKAQIVYSEEGYEDSAYDHGGEQKHASDHESHGGYLKQNEISKGKFKIPSFITNHEDSKGSDHHDEILHGQKWKDDLKETDDENESDYYESQEGNSYASDINKETIRQNDRSKRNSENILNDSYSESNKNNVNKSYLDNYEQRNEKVSNVKRKEIVPSDTNIRKKYPYYFQNLTLLSQNSPIRYAENYELIPKKSNGGTEFYDSRANLECPEVEDNIDPLPEKLHKEGHPDEPSENDESLSDDKAKDEAKFRSLKNNQRLKGLGDKIDCFKAKYFGANPLDNPFFNEDIIENPKPVTIPNLKAFDIKQFHNLGDDTLSTSTRNSDSLTDKLRHNQSFIKNSSTINPTIVSKSSEVLSTSMGSEKISNKLTNKTFVYKRRKRATPFTYEPYKIIKDSQIPDSKKTTTTSNISPLIKKLQSSRLIEKVTINQDNNQTVKKPNTKTYKTIGKDDRQENRNHQSNESNLSFIDVNSDQRRGEPRYELRQSDHKSSIDNEEKSKNGEDKNSKNTETTTQSSLKRSKRRKTTLRPFFDVSQYLPQSVETQQIAASNTVRKIIRTTTENPTSNQHYRANFDKNNKNDKEYDEYIDVKEDTEHESDIVTSTTTIKPIVKKKTRGTTTKPIEVEEGRELRTLRPLTRFHAYQPKEDTFSHFDVTESPIEKSEENKYVSPKYSEKKKKSSKSTLVTDVESYGVEGDDEDYVREKEIDDLIGVKQDMEEYLPLYERVVNKINRMKNENVNKHRDHKFDREGNIYMNDKYHFPEEAEAEEEEEEEEEEDDEDDDDYDDDDENVEGDVVGNRNNAPNENDNVEVKELDNDYRKSSDTKAKDRRLQVTTSEPTKRTLIKTTEAPATTTESRSAKLSLKPIISKKKVEIHNELPINTSSSHKTQFKQDIKEIEITKESAKHKPNKNVEALELYKDEKLAEEINKLGDVEIFRENLDLKSGPRHGGNYRSITPKELEKEIAIKTQNIKHKDDAETSQTETRKIIEVEKDTTSTKRGRYNGRNRPQKAAKFTESRESYDSKPEPLHGGNLKLPRSKDKSHNSKSEKYVEIEDDEEDEPSSMHGGNFKSYGHNKSSGREMHGGNYRSEKLVKNIDEKQPQTRGKSKTTRIKAASTTTLPYILDPSKRMYYYVDA